VAPTWQSVLVGAMHETNSASSETDGAGERSMVGILVHGNNHYILSGPLPNEAEALAMARNWSLVQIGEQASPIFQRWEIRNKEFRENLQWAAIVPGDRATSPGVAELLRELAARGVEIRRFLVQDT